jgi:hypothetical protein
VPVRKRRGISTLILRAARSLPGRTSTSTGTYAVTVASSRQYQHSVFVRNVPVRNGEESFSQQVVLLLLPPVPIYASITVAMLLHGSTSIQ